MSEVLEVSVPYDADLMDPPLDDHYVAPATSKHGGRNGKKTGSGTESAIDSDQPHDRNAEEAVLGSVLINPEVFVDVAQYVSAEDFYIRRHGFIWEAFQRLFDRREALDYVTVLAELENMGKLIEIGGPPGITRFLSSVPSSLHAEDYAKIVASFATRRRLLQAANNIATLAFSENFDASKAMDVAEKAIFDAAGSQGVSEVVELSEVAGEFYDYVDSNYENPRESGIPTGFVDLDKLMGGGMQKTDLIVVAARPGVGKSGFLLSVAGNTSKQGYRVGVFSLEMSNVQLIQRMISQNTGIDTMRLRTGQIHDDEWGVFTEAVEHLSSYNVFLDDTPNLSPMSLRSKCRRRHMSCGLDLIIIDYLQLMSGDNRFDNRVQEISYISRNLKMLAKELNVPVLVAAQLSRAVEQRADKRPILSDLRESGSIEQDADIVMFIHRPEANGVEDPAMENLAELIVAKQRNGPVDSVELVYRKNLTKFDNAFVNRLNLSHIS